ncbi:MAG: class I SAM-dependent methyltransferase [Candidatus Schekmanbacteria bacterium]|nr:class I SAM-dependent methyltransferase [Candidatus Schekmanbacteria bacterium]
MRPFHDGTQGKQASWSSWDDLYREHGGAVWGYDALPFVVDFAELIRSQLPTNARLLDAAAGTGRNLSALLSLPAELVASDGSSHALRAIPAESLARIRRVQADMTELPFDDESFSAIIATDVIETIEQPLNVLRELRRVLRKDGLLLCNVPGADDGVAGHDMTPLADGGFVYSDRFYYHFHSPEEASILLSEAGLRVLEARRRVWMEEAHMGFRDFRHEHVSHVFLAGR